MRKRPGLLDSIDMQANKKSTSQVTVLENKTDTKIKKSNVKTSLYLPPKAHRKLKEIALANDCKVHDLVIDGINKVLKENGFPPVQDL